jgi:HAD superfamily hydrolase (TIGR01549 family)
VTDLANTNVKLAVFDYDMTIVDSSDAITTGMNALANEMGLRPVTKEEVKKGIGLPILDAFYDLWGASDPTWIDHYRQRIVDIEYTLIKPYNETIPTLTELRKKGLKLALASNRQRPRSVLEKTDLIQYFDDVIGSYDCVAPKPSPEMLNTLMSRFSVSPDETVYTGDSLIDIETAVSAKVRGIGVTTGIYNSEEIISAGAWKCIDNLWELTKCLIY